jgi:hypothetical protein
MTDEFKGKVAGDPIFYDEVPGCFLCGFKPEPEHFGMSFMRLDELHGPVFFVCVTCANENGAEEACREKFMKLQEEANRGQSKPSEKA